MILRFGIQNARVVSTCVRVGFGVAVFAEGLDIEARFVRFSDVQGRLSVCSQGIIE